MSRRNQELRNPMHGQHDDFWLVVFLVYLGPWLIALLLGAIAWTLQTGVRALVEFAGIPEHFKTVYLVVFFGTWFTRYSAWKPRPSGRGGNAVSILGTNREFGSWIPDKIQA